MSADVSEHVIQAVTHGRYLFRPGSGTNAPLLVGFHGYAETAVVQMQRLQEIPGSDRWALCAIEGLHQFYRLRDDQVVSSWMTRLLRDQAIDDNIAYVDSIVSRLQRRPGVSNTVVYTGFSQGVAMAYRAGLSGNSGAGIMALAGDVPPEVTPPKGRKCPALLLGQCRDDEWYTSRKLEDDLGRLDQLGIHVETFRMDCGHEWTTAFSKRCAAFLDRFS